MKILFLQKRILFPVNTGWKVRTLNVVRYLARWHDVTYLCNVLPEDEPHLGAMRDLGVRLVTAPWVETPRGSLRFYGELFANLFTRVPYTVAKDYDRALRRQAEALVAEGGFDLVVCDFVQMALNAMGLEGPRSLLFQHNVEAEIFRRHATGAGSWARRWYMGHQWRKMRRFEGEAGRAFDGAIAVSERDRDAFEREYGWPWVRVIDTAVDLEYFRPEPDAEKPGHVAFVGSMDWLPNEDGVRWFVESIWPEVRRRVPGAVFQVVGRNPPAAIRKLGGAEGVEVTGTVPDVRPYFAGAAVVAIPLLVGGGTRLKVFEAMSMGRPVVSTALGAEGLPVEDGAHLVLVDEPGRFAAEVVRLLKDAEARRALGARARGLVEARFSAETVARQFDAICRELVDGTPGDGPPAPRAS